MLTLFGQSKSINVRKVLWTLTEIDLPFVQEDWGGEARSVKEDAYLQINPKGLIPVLRDGDLVLTESNSICRYLASHHSRSDLLPVQASQRAIVEAWMDWQATDLNTAWRVAFMGLVRKDPEFSDPEGQGASTVEWNEKMMVLEEALSSSDGYICGSTFTLADIVLALSTNRWIMTPMERPQLPAVFDWMARLSSRPGFQQHCCNGVP